MTESAVLNTSLHEQRMQNTLLCGEVKNSKRQVGGYLLEPEAHSHSNVYTTYTTARSSTIVQQTMAHCH